MRSCPFVVLAILIFFHARFGHAEIYTQETFKAIVAASQAKQPTCKQIMQGCSAQASTYRKYFEPAAIACKAEQQSMGCDKLAVDHPELKSQINSCDAADLCENNVIAQEVQAMKGCFWNAPGAITKDTWNDIKNLVTGIPGAAKKGWDSYVTCMADSDCRKFVATQMMIASNPVIMSTEVSAYLSTDQGKAMMLGMYNSGKKWLSEQGVKYQCFNPEAQTEMLCYGAYWAVVNVVAPEKLGAVAAAKIPLAIKVLKGVAAARKGEVVAVDTVRAAEVVADTSKVVKLDSALGGTAEAQNTFIAENMNRIFTSTQENEAWIKVAEQVPADRPTKFFDIENSAMKKLNDTTDNKNLVTALTNKQKEIFFNDLHDLAKQYPDFEFLPYSDFKSVRLAVRPKSASGFIPPRLNRALQDLFESTNQKFTQTLVDNKVVAASAKPQEWFRAGSGVTADQASLAARYSRSVDGENRMVGFGNDQLKANLQATLNQAESYRRSLQISLGRTPVMEAVPGTTDMTLSRDAFEVARKAKSPSEVKEALALRTGANISDAQAQKILDYSKMVDEFSPSIRVARREVTTLEDATHGGLTIDFVGLGAQNSQATANALVRSKDVSGALMEARQHEGVVTRLLDDKKKNITEAIQKVLKEQNIDAVIKVSGDDMVIKPVKPLDNATKVKIADALAQVENPSSIRMSSVSQNVTDGTARSVLAAQGESVEKTLRKALAGKIPNQKLSQTMFMVDIDKTAAGTNQAKLIMSNRYTDLTAAEKKEIQKAFHDAVQQISDGAKKVDLHFATEAD